MLGQVDRFGGEVVGDSNQPGGTAPEVDVAEVLRGAGAEELVVCSVPIDTGSCDQDGNALVAMVEVVLQASLDPETGALQWGSPSGDDDDGDDEDAARRGILRAAITRSQMTSMLRDTTRNLMYERAIAAAVSDFTTRHGRAPHVLDIGTGTGLLAMLSARAGAERVTACEMFRPLCSLASRIAATNGFYNIDFLAVRSNDVLVAGDHDHGGDGNDDDDDERTMRGKADMLVSEILDTVLLGEAVLPAVRDARARLLAINDNDDDDSSVIILPQSASIVAQLVHSPWADRASLFPTIEPDPSSSSTRARAIELVRSDDARGCRGSSAIPVHAEQLPYQPLSDAMSVMEIDLAHPPSTPRDCEPEHSYGRESECFSNSRTRNRSRSKIRAVADGTVNAVLFWWRVRLYNDVYLCTGPSAIAGQEHERRHLNGWHGTDGWWQDHWLQALMPLPSTDVHQGDELLLTAVHTDLQLWFHLQPASAEASTNANASDSEAAHDTKRRRVAPTSFVIPEPPTCECGLHLLSNPLRVSMLSDRDRMRRIYSAISSLVRELRCEPAAAAAVTPLVCLDTSDGSLCSLMAAAAGADVVVSLEQHQLSEMVWGQIVRFNELDTTIVTAPLPAHALTQERLAETLHEFCHSHLSSDDDDDYEDGNVGGNVDGGRDAARRNWLATVDAPEIDLLMNEMFDVQMQHVPITAAFSFWLQRSHLHQLLSPRARIFPGSAIIKAVAIELLDLPQGHGVVGNVSGFEHSLLDEVQHKWAAHSYAYPLWMYRFRVVSEVLELLHLDYYSLADDVSVCEKPVPFTEHDGTCNAVAYWVDYYSGRQASDATLVTSTGPLPQAQPCSWKQSVRFLEQPLALGASSSMFISASFQRESAAIRFEHSTR